MGETAHPPPAPRSRPSAHAPPQAPGRGRPDSSLPPAPPAGGKITLQYRAHKSRIHRQSSLAGTCLRSVALRSAKSPLAHYFTLDREQGVSIAARALRRSSIARSSFASLLFARSFFARSSYAPCLFARSLHALYLAANRKFNTLQNRTHERIDIKTNCRAPQAGRGGPVPPSRPAFVARLALAAPLCAYMINRISHFRASI